MPDKPHPHETMSELSHPAGTGERRATRPSGQPKVRPWPRWAGIGLVLLAGAAVFHPALRSLYLLDDYLHSSMIHGTFVVPRHPLDLYNFVDDSDRALLRERGLLPWWSDPELTIRFFRPLSSGLRWAEHRLFGDRPLPGHLHSFLWWIASVLAARGLFRRSFAPRTAAIATFVFALAPCHAIPLAWLANREALVSLSLGTLGLLAHLRWRDGGSIGHALLAALCFALAMLGGEYAISIGAYVLALELVRREAPLARRALGLAPFAVPAIAYLALRARLGYGARGSGYYSDPFVDPIAFLESVPRRVATLLLEAWFSLDQHTLPTSTPWWWIAILFTVAALAIAPVVRRSIAALDPSHRRGASWMLLGSILALAPVLAVVPSPRLLGASMLGTAPIVALALEAAWFPAAPEPRRGIAELSALVAVALGFSHLVHGPITSFLMGRTFMRSTALFAYQAHELRERVGDMSEREVIVVRGMGGSFFLPFALHEHGRPPRMFRILAQTGHALVLRRAERVLELVAPAERGAFPDGEGNLFLDEDCTVSEGQTFETPGMRATILELSEGRPRVVRYELESDLDDPIWLNESAEGFVDASPPELGFGRPFDP